MKKLTFHDFDRLKYGHKVDIYHNPSVCRPENFPQGKVEFRPADVDDFMTSDGFFCTDCESLMDIVWFTAEHQAWIDENYTLSASGGCECGSYKGLGIEPYRAGHSFWCPVHP